MTVIQEPLFDAVSPDDFAITKQYVRPATAVIESLLVSVVLFLAIFFLIDPAAPILTRFDGTLFITSIFFLAILFHLLKKIPTSLDEFCASNQNRFTPVRYDGSDALLSVIWSTVGLTTAAKLSGDPISEMTHNAILRNDGQTPQFTLGRVENSDAYKGYLFITISLSKPCPHVFIDYDQNTTPLQATSFVAKLTSDQRYDLEGEFGNIFTMYAETPSAARFATYIFTPDVMEKFMKIMPRADLEIQHDKLTIIWKPGTDTPNWRTQLPQLFTVLNTIVDLLASRVTDYIGDATVDKTSTGLLRPTLVGHADKAVRLMATNAVTGQLQTWLAFILSFILLVIVCVVQVSITMSS